MKKNKEAIRIRKSIFEDVFKNARLAIVCGGKVVCKSSEPLKLVVKNKPPYVWLKNTEDFTYAVTSSGMHRIALVDNDDDRIMMLFDKFTNEQFDILRVKTGKIEFTLE